MLFMKKNFKIFSKKVDNGIIYTMGTEPFSSSGLNIFDFLHTI